jgi:hypothetical protein
LADGAAHPHARDDDCLLYSAGVLHFLIISPIVQLILSYLQHHNKPISDSEELPLTDSTGIDFLLPSHSPELIRLFSYSIPAVSRQYLSLFAPNTAICRFKKTAVSSINNFPISQVFLFLQDSKFVPFTHRLSAPREGPQGI